MDDKFESMGERERQIAALLLRGYENDAIANELHMPERTVKAYFNRMFVRFGINGGIKRVKLATLLYRRQLWLDSVASTGALPQSESPSSSNTLPPATKTSTLPTSSELPRISSKTICG